MTETLILIAAGSSALLLSFAGAALLHHMEMPPLAVILAPTLVGMGSYAAICRFVPIAPPRHSDTGATQEECE